MIFLRIFFGNKIVPEILQVPSPIEGPGGVTAEAIFDRVEQIARESLKNPLKVFEGGFGELIPLKISW